jgi:[ribosomal protein S5]-alanine N-acetyltransferase
MKNVLMESERFFLRTLIEDDVNARYLEWINGSDKSQYINYTNQNRNVDEVSTFVTERVNSDTVLFLGIFVRESGEHIGNIKYEPIDFKKSYAIMGILIGEKNWRGRGVAAEVIIKSSTWLHEKYGVRQFILGVNTGNVWAIRAYKKVGFRQKQTPMLSAMDEATISMVWDIK